MDTVETASCEVEEIVRLQVAPQSYKVAGGESSKQPLTIFSSDAKAMQSLVACAIEQNIEQALVSIKVLEQEIQGFETKYSMSSAEFLRRYREDEIPETLETIDWCFSWRQHEHLCQRLQFLREASFEI